MAYSSTSSKLQGVGDPGLFGFLGKAVGGIAGTLLKGSPIGIAAGAVGAAIGGRKTGGTPTFTAPGGATVSSSFQERIPLPGVVPAIQRAVPGGATGFAPRKKRRRMDPLNVKALRRSTRRLAAFQREAKKVEKELRKLAPPARRRSSSAHHHHPKA